MALYPVGPAHVWNKIGSDFLANMRPGTYMLRKDRFNDPKYYASLTGVYDGYSDRVKFVLDERDDIPYEILYKYVMEETGGRDMDALHRKVYMASFKYKCGKYNIHLDSFPLSSQRGLIRLHYENSLADMLASLNADLLMMFDSYTRVRTEYVVPVSSEGSPGPSKRKANDEQQQGNANEKRVRMT